MTNEKIIYEAAINAVILKVVYDKGTAHGWEEAQA